MIDNIALMITLPFYVACLVFRRIWNGIILLLPKNAKPISHYQVEYFCMENRFWIAIITLLILYFALCELPSIIN